MLPHQASGEHKLKLLLEGEVISETIFHVLEESFTIRFKATLDPPQGFNNFITCWPGKNIQTIFVGQNNSNWLSFLPQLFSTSQKWNDLIKFWEAERPHIISSLSSPLSCANLESNAIDPDNIYVDFLINRKHFTNEGSISVPVPVHFDSYRSHGSIDAQIRSTLNLSESLNVALPIKYRNVDLSQKSALVLREGIPLCLCVPLSIYDNLVAVYQWAGTLYIIKKAIPEIALFDDSICLACNDILTTLIIDHPGDLPARLIEVP